MRQSPWRRVSDRAYIINFGDEISDDLHARVMNCVRRLLPLQPRYISQIQPAYGSVTVVFDLLRFTGGEIKVKLEEALSSAAAGAGSAKLENKKVEIPVCYEDAFAPDIKETAELCGMSVDKLIAAHSEAVYRVHFLGFLPGFAYLGGLPPELNVPRLPAPRVRVPEGSVGLANGQTGVYPLAAPGGWRLIGRTPLRLFNPELDPVSFLNIGDEVTFRPISPTTFRDWVRL